jgi:CRISPR-associated protein Csb2
VACRNHLCRTAGRSLLIGDGRYLGLGLLAPQRAALPDAVAFAVSPEAGVATADGFALAHAARRALMALSRDAKGDVPRLFSGHEEDGGRAASGRHKHIFIAADDNDGDGRIDRLIVAAPWACDRSSKPDRAERRQFDAVVSELETLRAGRLGVIALGKRHENGISDRRRKLSFRPRANRLCRGASKLSSSSQCE